MQAFPPECQTALASLGRVVETELARRAFTQQAETKRTRQAFYLHFCKEMSLPDPCGSGQQFEFMLACFVQTLIGGNNITNATIRAKTVKGYLEAVSELFELRNFESPYQPHRPENMPAFMISLLEKWENMPSRREPISAEMTDYLERRANEADPDSITAVVWD